MPTSRAKLGPWACPRCYVLEAGRIAAASQIAAHLNVIIGKVDTRTLGHESIQINDLFYNDRETVGRLRRAYGARFVVKVKYNPDDLGLIYILDPGCEKWLPIPCTELDYADGLTLYQHQVIQRFRRQMAEAHTPVADWCEAKLRVRELIQRGLANSKRGGPGKAIGRFADLGSNRQPDENRLDSALSAKVSAPALEILLRDDEAIEDRPTSVAEPNPLPPPPVSADVPARRHGKRRKAEVEEQMFVEDAKPTEFHVPQPPLRQAQVIEF